MNSTALYRTFIPQSFVWGHNSNDPVVGRVCGVVVDESRHAVCLPSVTWNVVVNHGWSLTREGRKWGVLLYRISKGCEMVMTPRYLSDRIVTYSPSHSLRSAVVPRINFDRYGRRTFSCAGPCLLKALPFGLRTQQDPDCFRRDLKTHLFNMAFS